MEIIIPTPSRYFPFFKLPLDIRSMIYAELLVERENVEKMFCKKHCKLWQKHRDCNRPEIASLSVPSIIHLAILRTCRQAYEEAMQVLYTKNIFRFSPKLLEEVGDSCVYDVRRCSNRNRPLEYKLNRRTKDLIRRVTVHIDYDPKDYLIHYLKTVEA